jgi:hypothetical protein
MKIFTAHDMKQTFIAFLSTMAVLFALVMLFAIATGGL